jgi:hypothetical protein
LLQWGTEPSGDDGVDSGDIETCQSCGERSGRRRSPLDDEHRQLISRLAGA